MSNRRTARLIALALMSAVAALAVAGGPSSQGAGTRVVAVDDDFFSPKRVTVPVGGKVRWEWRGAGLHNVTFRKVPKGASKRRARTRTEGRFTRSFGKAGRYRYVCTIHEDLGMKGSVTAN